MLVGNCDGVRVLLGTRDRFLRLHAELAQSQAGAGQRERCLLVPRVQPEAPVAGMPAVLSV